MLSSMHRYEKLKLDMWMLITVEGSSSSVSPGKVLASQVDTEALSFTEEVTGHSSYMDSRRVNRKILMILNK